MIPVGILLSLVGYGVGSWGYVLVKGYDVTLREWFSPLNPYSGPWPPPGIPNTQIFPGKAGAAAPGSSGPPGIGTKPGPGGKCPPGTVKTIDGRCVSIAHE